MPRVFEKPLTFKPKVKGPKIPMRSYWNEHCIKQQVLVKDRKNQMACTHVWRDRVHGEIESGWKHVCEKCGICSR